jgi:acetoin utilization deacetylase AcuC-like enzyme
MQIIHSLQHQGHGGAMELNFNRMVPMFERPERMDAILKELDRRQFGILIEPESFGLEPIHRIHDKAYVDFLARAYDLWQEQVGMGRFANATMFAMRGMKQVPGNSVQAMLSAYTFDICVPFVAGTWEAIKSAADCALTAQSFVQQGERAAFALCRPPGHHSSQDLAGGYCYLNNAAIAAQAFLDQGAHRVAVLDVDYHHGNGTQRIFYERDDVLYVSIHGRPEEEFPYVLGFADETGAGAGEGFNVNLPLPKGALWPAFGQALSQAVKAVRYYRPDVVVVSLGLDAYKDDPVGGFRLESEDFTETGRMIATIGLPTLFVMEGGYAIDALGFNVVNLLAGYES